MSEEKPILVTGSHRSGTTWVGRMLALSRGVGYIHEPFNLDHSMGVFPVRIGRWFTYVTRENEAPYSEPLRRMLDFGYDIPAAIKGVRSMRDLRRAFADRRSFARHGRSGARPLVKDPLALLSCEWLAARFGMKVVILIRHPAAFAASLKRLSWALPFAHFLEQPLLMRDHLETVREDITEFARQEKEILDQAALLWRILYGVVAKYRAAHEDWIFIRHEDLARDPPAGFRALYERLGLDLTRPIEAAIRGFSVGPEVGRSDIHSIQRDSEREIALWRKELTQAEIDGIRSRVEEVSKSFYRDDEW